MASTPPGWPAQLPRLPPDGQRSCGTQWSIRGRSMPRRGRQSSRGPTRRRPLPPSGQLHRKLCGVTRIVNRWTAQLRIAVVHLGRLSQRRPSESYPGPARAQGAKQHVPGRLGPRARSGFGRWGRRSSRTRIKELGQPPGCVDGPCPAGLLQSESDPAGRIRPRHPATPPKGRTQRRSAAADWREM